MIRLISLITLLGLLVSATLAQVTPGKPAAPVKLLSVTPEKILYDIGEPITGTVIVQNLSPVAQTVSVRAWLEWDLDQRNNPLETLLTIAPGKTANASFSFPKSPARYGHAFKAKVVQNGNVIATGEDYFNVCNNYWNVALINAMGFIWNQYDNFIPKKDTQWADGILAGYRKEYYNGFEHFFWAQDDFLGMTPRQDLWWSGQARYLESKPGLRALIAKAHRQGIKAITYAKLTGGGSYGAEMARKHPEWVWQSNGTLLVDRQAKQLEDWDVTSKEHWGGWVATNWNMNDPQVLNIGIKQLSDSATMFGWDGARWDGTFEVQSEVYSLDGKLLERLTPEQVDAHNAENMRHTKETISKLHPRFIYGYNWTQGNWGQSLTSNPRESIELARNGGMIMNEYINQAEGVQHPLHRWDVFAQSVVDDVERIKKLGGYYGPILNSNDSADGRYTNIFAYAAGAHPYYHHLWGAFMTRYSAFCWDNALTHIHDPDDLLLAPANLWWRNWVFERQLDNGHKQLIVHLINPPAKPTVGEGKRPEDVPPPVKDSMVSIFPALLNGWTPVRATRLSPEPLLKTAVPITRVEGVYQLKIPEIALWNILVIDLVNKGGH